MCYLFRFLPIVFAILLYSQVSETLVYHDVGSKTDGLICAVDGGISNRVFTGETQKECPPYIW